MGENILAKKNVKASETKKTDAKATKKVKKSKK